MSVFLSAGYIFERTAQVLARYEATDPNETLLVSFAWGQIRRAIDLEQRGSDETLCDERVFRCRRKDPRKRVTQRLRHETPAAGARQEVPDESRADAGGQRTEEANVGTMRNELELEGKARLLERNRGRCHATRNGPVSNDAAWRSVLELAPDESNPPGGAYQPKRILAHARRGTWPAKGSDPRRGRENLNGLRALGTKGVYLASNEVTGRVPLERGITGG